MRLGIIGYMIVNNPNEQCTLSKIKRSEAVVALKGRTIANNS